MKQGVLAKLARHASASARWPVKTGTYSIIRHRVPHAMCKSQLCKPHIYIQKSVQVFFFLSDLFTRRLPWSVLLHLLAQRDGAGPLRVCEVEQLVLLRAGAGGELRPPQHQAPCMRRHPQTDIGCGAGLGLRGHGRGCARGASFCCSSGQPPPRPEQPVAEAPSAGLGVGGVLASLCDSKRDAVVGGRARLRLGRPVSGETCVQRAPGAGSGGGGSSVVAHVRGRFCGCCGDGVVAVATAATLVAVASQLFSMPSRAKKVRRTMTMLTDVFWHLSKRPCNIVGVISTHNYPDPLCGCRVPTSGFVARRA